MIVGVGLAVLSALAFNVAFVVQKQALSGMPAVHAVRTVHLARTLMSSPRWMGGFLLSLTGTGLQVLALGRAPLAVVLSIVASGIVVLLVLSHYVLHEHLGRLEWVGIAGVGGSLLLVCLSLESSTTGVGTNSSWLRVAGAALPTVVLAGAALAVATRRTRRSAPFFGLSAGLAYGMANLATKSVGLLVEDRGLTGAIPRALRAPDVYLLGLFAAGGLIVFQTGLQRGRAAVVVPISNVIATAYPVAVGMVIFGEPLPAPAWRTLARFAGFGGVLVGTAVLSAGRAALAAYRGARAETGLEAAASTP